MLARATQVFLGMLAALLVTAAVGLGVASLVSHANQQTVACNAVNQLRSVLSGLVMRSEKSIPTISYYKQHPDELARVQAQTRAEAQELQPIHC